VHECFFITIYLLIVKRGFIMIFLYTHEMYFSHADPLCSCFLSHHPPFKAILIGVILFSQKHIKYFSYTHPPPSPLLLFIPFLLIPTLKMIMQVEENMWYLSPLVWLILLNMIVFSYMHLPTKDIISFFMTEYYSIVYIYTTFSLPLH
jgi:hypothetical protein